MIPRDSPKWKTVGKPSAMARPGPGGSLAQSLATFSAQEAGYVGNVGIKWYKSYDHHD